MTTQGMPTLKIDSIGNGFHVSRVNTSSIVAQMVYSHTFWNWANKGFIGMSMGSFIRYALSIPKSDMAITIFIGLTKPLPTSFCIVFPDAVPEVTNHIRATVINIATSIKTHVMGLTDAFGNRLSRAILNRANCRSHRWTRHKSLLVNTSPLYHVGS